jgi:hypothetical protein
MHLTTNGIFILLTKVNLLVNLITLVFAYGESHILIEVPSSTASSDSLCFGSSFYIYLSLRFSGLSAAFSSGFCLSTTQPWTPTVARSICCEY